MKILTTCRLPEDILAKISTHYDISSRSPDPPKEPDHLRETVVDCQGILCTISDTIDAAVFDMAPRR